MRAAVIILAALLLPAAPATAATVSVSDSPLGELRFRAVAGEANDVTVALERTAVVVRDASATVTPRRRCRALDPHAVRCRIGADFLHAEFALGDGNDRADVPPARTARSFVRLLGGQGDDELAGIGDLNGGAGDDRLTGTDKDEQFDGGIGADVIRGLDGDDTFTGDAEPFGDSTGGPKSPDMLDGGAGEDTVEYTARRAPVTIDLTAGTGGEAGENDTLIGIENAHGGKGSDTITGDELANEMHGGGGRDTLIGLGGDDLLGAGHRIDAGPGDDSVYEYGPELGCGPGVDLLDNQRYVLPKDAPPVPDDCERWQLDTDVLVGAHPRVGRDAVVLRLRCSFSCRLGVLRFAVRRRGELLARGRVMITRRGPATARLRLTADGRRALRRRRVVTIALRSTAPARTRWRAAIG